MRLSRVNANDLCIFDKDNGLGLRTSDFYIVRALKCIKTGPFKPRVWTCQVFDTKQVINITEKLLYPIDLSELTDDKPNIEKYVVVRNPPNIPEITDKDVYFLDMAIKALGTIDDKQVNGLVVMLKKIWIKLEFYRSMLNPYNPAIKVSLNQTGSFDRNRGLDFEAFEEDDYDEEDDDDEDEEDGRFI